MTRILSVLLTIFVLVTAGQAQTSKVSHVYVGAGFSMLTGHYADLRFWNTGLHGLAGLGFEIAPGFELMPKLEYHRFAVDDRGMTISGGAMGCVLLGGAARYAIGLPAATVKPVILGGFGLGFNKKSEISGVYHVYGASETKPYIEIGGGMEFKTAPRTKLFWSIRYVTVGLQGASLCYVPVTFGIIF